jgi:hypothetical protein
MSPTVFIRLESIDHITEVQIQAMDFLHGNWDDLDALFWRHLTPSAYARLQNGFLLKIWRRPNWIVKQFRPHDKENVKIMWRAMLNMAVDRDVLWLDPMLP